jgi:phage terminase small subunit
MVRSLPKPPEHLSSASQTLWRSVIEDYELEPHHLELLRLALEALDRCEQARRLIEEEGPVFRDRFGCPRPHPRVAIERDSRIAAARLWRELDLEGEPMPDPRMPRRPQR